MRKTMVGLLVGVSFAAMGSLAQAQELTILWAEWDPANYLQELVNDYTAETGVTVSMPVRRSRSRSEMSKCRSVGCSPIASSSCQ